MSGLTIYKAWTSHVTFCTDGDRPETATRADLTAALVRVIAHGDTWLGDSSVDESDLAALTTAMDEAS